MYLIVMLQTMQYIHATSERVLQQTMYIVDRSKAYTHNKEIETSSITDPLDRIS